MLLFLIPQIYDKFHSKNKLVETTKGKQRKNVGLSPLFDKFCTMDRNLVRSQSAQTIAHTINTFNPVRRTQLAPEISHTIKNC